MSDVAKRLSKPRLKTATWNWIGRRHWLEADLKQQWSQKPDCPHWLERALDFQEEPQLHPSPLSTPHFRSLSMVWRVKRSPLEFFLAPVWVFQSLSMPENNLLVSMSCVFPAPLSVSSWTKIVGSTHSWTPCTLTLCISGSWQVFHPLIWCPGSLNPGSSTSEPLSGMTLIQLEGKMLMITGGLLKCKLPKAEVGSWRTSKMTFWTWGRMSRNFKARLSNEASAQPLNLSE